MAAAAPVNSLPRLRPHLALPALGKPYHQKLLSRFAGGIVAFYPLFETSGSLALDVSGAFRHGAYTGVSLAHAPGPRGRPAGLWDGVNDFCDIYSASLNAAFNGNEGSLLLWMRAFNAGVWSDAVLRRVVMLYSNGTNYIILAKTTASNTLQFSHAGSGSGKNAAYSGMAGNANWFHAAGTWSLSNNRIRLYVNGSQVASQTGIGAWSGSLSSAQTLIGATDKTPNHVWNGWLGYALLLNREASAAEVAAAYAMR